MYENIRVPHPHPRAITFIDTKIAVRALWLHITKSDKNMWTHLLIYIYVCTYVRTYPPVGTPVWSHARSDYYLPTPNFNLTSYQTGDSINNL